MDAPTAALIGAGLGFGGALFTAWLNPFSTAKHAREAKQLERRIAAYADGIKAVVDATITDDLDSMGKAVDAVMAPAALMELVGSPDVSKLYDQVGAALDALHREAKKGNQADPAKLKTLVSEYFKARQDFLDAARADIGADAPYYDK